MEDEIKADTYHGARRAADGRVHHEWERSIRHECAPGRHADNFLTCDDHDHDHDEPARSTRSSCRTRA